MFSNYYYYYDNIIILMVTFVLPSRYTINPLYTSHVIYSMWPDFNLNPTLKYIILRSKMYNILILTRYVYAFFLSYLYTIVLLYDFRDFYEREISNHKLNYINVYNRIWYRLLLILKNTVSSFWKLSDYPNWFLLDT